MGLSALDEMLLYRPQFTNIHYTAVMKPTIY